MKELTKHLQVVKICTEPHNYKKICSGLNYQYYPTYVLNNGVVLGLHFRDPYTGGYSCSGKLADVMANKGSYGNKCARLYVDINGLNGPNKVGRDIFAFIFYTDGLIPAGAISIKGASWIDTFDDACYPLEFAAVDNSTCTAWVIYHENLDYLKCRDKLSWEGAHSCKAANKN